MRRGRCADVAERSADVVQARAQTLEFRLLGAVSAAAGGRTLDVASQKQRALLAALLLGRGRAISSDRLIEVLWGDHPPPSAHSTLRSLVARLRRVLADGEDEPPLRGRDGGYVLDVRPGQVDAWRFEQLVDEARAARENPERVAEALRLAVGLFTGPALGDLADRDFARPEARRLDEARLTAIEDLADAELALGQPAVALSRLEPHVGAHPLRERAWGQLMLALYRLGRQAEALRAYQELRRVLVEELGIEPTPALRQLEERILHQHPELDHQPAGGIAERAAVRTLQPTADLGDTTILLFTDIEASTRRWEGDQAAMAADLFRHDELLTAAVAAWNGQVFGHTGDGLCAAFPTAGAALGAAVAGQLALASAEWNAARPLQVRMAVHAGAAEHRAGNYFGPTLNRTARLLATAAGGQIVCSEAAAHLTDDGRPSGIELVDLGEHRLADLGRPERVFQVTHAGLRADFPPLRSLDVKRHNLPAALTSFIGRRREQEEVAALLGQARLVTLTGIGGTGKTRLAVAVAAGAAERFADGVWLAELAPLRDPSLVVSAVVAALGLLPGELVRQGQSLERALCDHLARRRLLLVLDNCEHLVEAAAALVHAILASCPDVTILTTSVAVLGVPGEVVYRVPPLALPPPADAGLDELTAADAVALFCERARAIEPGFELTPANAAAVARICHRLDGIPLALELAAARIRVLGAHQVADRLDQGFGLLGGGARTDDPRHQTLRAAVDWSHNLLPPAEQRVLRRLSVFPGSFDLEAAEAVAGVVDGDHDDGGPVAPDFETLDHLSRLIDKSFVVVAERQDSEVRYRLLETIRAYAGEQLAGAGEEALIGRRHRDFFCGLAEEWNRTVPETWAYTESLRRIGIDVDNFRAALRWSWAAGDDEAVAVLASAQAYYWAMEASVEGRDWLERVLAMPATPLRAAVVARVQLALLLRNVGGYTGDRPRDLLEEALRIALAGDDPAMVLMARSLLVEVSLATGDIDEAERQLSAVPSSCRASEHVREGFLGWVAMARGDVGAARDHFERSLEAGGGKDDFFRAHMLAGLCLVMALLDQPDEAEAVGEEAIGAARLFPGRQILVMALTRAAEVAVFADRPERAELILRELLTLLRELGALRWVARALELAALLIGASDRAAARSLFTAADAVRTALREPANPAWILGGRIEDCRRRIADELGGDALGGAVGPGRAMTIDDAIASALAGLSVAI
jgi:predicted ATPase/DNA-binding SARP family transcriptional activator